jgi:hypothetical protein
MNPTPASSGAGGEGTEVSAGKVAKKWSVKGADKGPASPVKGAENGLGGPVKEKAVAQKAPSKWAVKGGGGVVVPPTTPGADAEVAKTPAVKGPVSPAALEGPANVGVDAEMVKAPPLKGTLRKFGSGAVVAAPKEVEEPKAPVLKASGFRKAAKMEGEVVKGPVVAPVKVGGEKEVPKSPAVEAPVERGVPVPIKAGLSKSTSRMVIPSTPPSAPPTKESAALKDAKKGFHASSPNILVRPNKPLPVAGASPIPAVVSPVVAVIAPTTENEEEPAPVAPCFKVEPANANVVFEKHVDDDEPPPEVPEFDAAPPALPEFSTDVTVQEDDQAADSLLDALFDEIVPAAQKNVAAKPPVVAKVAEPDLSESFLDSVFNEIAAAPTKEAVVGSKDLSDSFLDSVFENVSKKEAPRVVAPAPEETDEDNDFLGAVLSQISSGAVSSGRSNATEMLLDVVETGGLKTSTLQQSGSFVPSASPSPSSSLNSSSSGNLPAGPALRMNPLGSPMMARPRVKSFAPSVIAPVDLSTIRAKKKSIMETEQDKGASKAKVSCFEFCLFVVFKKMLQRFEV